MTLMDAPKFDQVGALRRTRTIYAFSAGVVLCLIAFWLFAHH